jgi:glucosamine-6-phosphate deaminase
MTSQIDPKQLHEWCRIPAAQLVNHPQAKVSLSVVSTPDQGIQAFAHMLLDEVRLANRANQPLRWILPCGPTAQYQIFAETVNRERLSLKNLHIFHMDDFLDWQGRPLPLDHPLNLKSYMLRNFYGRIEPDLNVPASQRHFPDPFDLEAVSQAITQVGGVDTVYGGIGYHGHIAFNEPIHSPWYTVTPEEYRRSRTRVLFLAEDTLIALSQRVTGGCSHCIPPMGITIGLADILRARRIRLFSATGAWKQTVIRILLFGPTTVEYPVTFVQGHPDVLVTVDSVTASHPFSKGKTEWL